MKTIKGGWFMVRALLRQTRRMIRYRRALRKVARGAPARNPQVLWLESTGNPQEDREHGYRCARWNDAQIARKALNVSRRRK